MTKTNPRCPCPANCPNHGSCADCNKNHHKGLSTYCKAGRLERAIRDLHARITKQSGGLRR